ncbi:putative F-box protein At1g32420 isoform X1 [Nicotiana tabacum]|uniref:F-box protein At1g32420 isoform X1 n=1 Tax=Nicotiana tabacum TaxID=4097 RepID=A0A1S4BTW6_TOBAC|nr:PREDICTED: F-box protein DOR-like isoform X1 [Nicotiana tabacum]
MKETLNLSKSTTTSSGAEMIMLSKDVMMDIFSRLRAKTLCRLRCVCKQWRSLISDPFFKSLHRAGSSLKPSLLFLEQKCCSTSTTRVSMSSFDLDGNHNFDFTFTLDSYVYFMPSKWELICFLGSKGKGFYVCNPSTQELVNLPNTPTSSRATLDGIAFGYIKEKNEYVLVNSRFFKNDTVCEVMRWTDGCCLKNLSWKVVDAKCPYMLRWCGVLVENSFYWIRHRNKYDSIEVIISFDLEKEDFGTVIPPKDTFDDGGLWSLAELMGMLWLFGSPEDISTMDIWVLKDSKNYMWAKEYTIDLAGFNFGVRFISILDHKEGKILMDVDSEILEWYDVDNKCFERVDNLSGAVHGNGCKSDWGRGRLVLSTNCWKISLYHPKFCFQLIDMRICVEPLKLI